jgi:hypothetical protein
MLFSVQIAGRPYAMPSPRARGRHKTKVGARNALVFGCEQHGARIAGTRRSAASRHAAF